MLPMVETPLPVKKLKEDGVLKYPPLLPLQVVLSFQHLESSALDILYLLNYYESR